MFDLSNLAPADGAVKEKKRKGRGPGSGLGKTAGYGHKGQKSRSGGAKPRWFEGGQMPLYRRLPKRGFSNYPFKVVYQVVNLDKLEAKFEAGEKVTKVELEKRRLIRSAEKPVKILARGEITKALEVEVDAISEKAKEKIEKAGGKVILPGAKKEESKEE